MNLIKMNNPNNVYLGYPVSSDLINANYYANLFSKEIIKFIKSDEQKIILLCRGSSGSILSSLTYIHLSEKIKNNIEICHIKKDSEKAHCDHMVSFMSQDNIYFIIDDLIESGETMKAILQYFKKRNVYRELIIKAILISHVSFDYKNNFDDICFYNEYSTIIENIISITDLKFKNG